MHDAIIIDALIKETESCLDAYHKQYGGLGWREKVRLLIPLSYSVKALGVNTSTEAAKVNARE